MNRQCNEECARIVRVVGCMNRYAMELRTKTTVLDDVAQVGSGAVSRLQ